jgi:hypothetical protein
MSHWMIENCSGGPSIPPIMSTAGGPGPCRFDVEPDTTDNDAANLRRWRRVVLRMSDTFAAAAVSQPELAPYLLEAMGHALEQLLLFGREKDLDMLDEWLSEGGHSS